MMGRATSKKRIISSRLTTLRHRKDFQRLRGGARWATKAFVLEARVQPAVDVGRITEAPAARFGFTVTKKIGGAVQRNRIRRRLKEAVRSLQQEHADRACDYVLIARRSALDHPFDDLIADLATAFRRVNRMRSCRNET